MHPRAIWLALTVAQHRTNLSADDADVVNGSHSTASGNPLWEGDSAFGTALAQGEAVATGKQRSQAELVF